MSYSREEIHNVIVPALMEVSDCSEKELLESDSLEDLIDSMARLELMFNLEDRYDIELDNDIAMNLNTVSDIVDCVEALIAKNVASETG